MEFSNSFFCTLGGTTIKKLSFHNLSFRTLNNLEKTFLGKISIILEFGIGIFIPKYSYDESFSASYLFWPIISLIKHIKINIGNVLCKIIYNNFLKTVNPKPTKTFTFRLQSNLLFELNLELFEQMFYTDKWLITRSSFQIPFTTT